MLPLIAQLGVTDLESSYAAGAMLVVLIVERLYKMLRPQDLETKLARLETKVEVMDSYMTQQKEDINDIRGQMRQSTDKLDQLIRAVERLNAKA